MAGILSYGAYVPFNRLQRSTIAAALDIPAGKGERSVASYDEDTATMAVEAAQKLVRKRIHVRVMAPQKVALAGFEPG